MLLGDRARGMIDVPLSPEGQKQADYLGQRIAAKGGVDTIVSSPMRRAVETARAVQRHNPRARLIGTSPGLDPLHQAGLEGLPRSEVAPAMNHFAHHPEQRIPGIGPSGVPGESLNEHAQRIGGEVRRQLSTLHPGERRLVLAHHSTIRAIRGWIKAGGHPDMRSDPREMASSHDVAKPADEILRLVKRHGGKPDLEPNPIDSDKPIQPGLNFVRHGATELNGPAKLARRGVMS